jgi:uncharacterized DUF497 family protein
MPGVELVGDRVALRELVAEDWTAVHEWASRPEACRFQTWGPNTPEETRAHVGRVIAAAAAQPRAHIARHGVAPSEVEQVCHSSRVQLRSRLDRIVLIGTTDTGRVLTAVLAPEGGGTYYAVTARSASRKERRFLAGPGGGMR